MRSGASDPSGPGVCYGVVAFNESGQQARMNCGDSHCETLHYCDGRERKQHCTVLARCDKGVAVAVGFTW